MPSEKINIGISFWTGYSGEKIGLALADIASDKFMHADFFESGMEYVELFQGTDQEHEVKLKQLVEDFFNNYQGLIIPGNSYNINPAFYSTDGLIDLNNENDKRNILEIRLVQKALQLGVPVLGVCGGHQILAVALGAVINNKIELLPDEIKNAKVRIPPDKIFNDEVKFMKNTLLHGALTNTELFYTPASTEKKNNDFILTQFNAHQQAIDPNSIEGLRSQGLLVVSAIDKNGIIKAIELNGHPFAMGTQFHPEDQYGGFESSVLAVNEDDMDLDEILSKFSNNNADSDDLYDDEILQDNEAVHVKLSNYNPPTIESYADPKDPNLYNRALFASFVETCSEVEKAKQSKKLVHEQLLKDFPIKLKKSQPVNSSQIDKINNKDELNSQHQITDLKAKVGEEIKFDSTSHKNIKPKSGENSRKEKLANILSEIQSELYKPELQNKKMTLWGKREANGIADLKDIITKDNMSTLTSSDIEKKYVLMKDIIQKKNASYHPLRKKDISNFYKQTADKINEFESRNDNLISMKKKI